MTTPSLDELQSHAEALPSLPEVVNYLIRSLRDEGADVDTIANHINADPAITARLLAAANSVGVGASRRIHSAREAFIVLGVDRIVNIILATALIHRFDTGGKAFDARQLWRHSLGVATCARVLADRCNINPDAAFTAGLLHDIGQLLMYTASPIDYMRVLELRGNEDISIVSAEQGVFGYDHAQAGQVLARNWNLPSEIEEAISVHHAPDEFGAEMGNLIHVSEVLSHALDLGEQANNRVPDLSDLACANLGLTWANFAGDFAEIEARYDGLRLALGL